MPNRILRDGINESESVNALSFRGEIFYRRLMSFADDYGRAPRSAALFRARLFGLQLERWTLDDVEKAVNECDAIGLTVSYEVNGKWFIEIQNFRQRIRPNVPSRFPAPRGVSPQVAAKSGERPQDAARASPSPSPSPSHTTPQGESEGVWLAAGFTGPEDAEAWFQQLLFRHPNRKGNGAARTKFLEKVQVGQFGRSEFERWYEEQIPIWQGWPQFPNLHAVFVDAEWRFPAVAADNSLSPTMRAVLAMEEDR